jgi:hypothetical protein
MHGYHSVSVCLWNLFSWTKNVNLQYCHKYVSCKVSKVAAHKCSTNLTSHLQILGARRGPTYIRHYNTKCNHLGDEALGICATLVKSLAKNITCQQCPVKQQYLEEWETFKLQVQCCMKTKYRKLYFPWIRQGLHHLHTNPRPDHTGN